MELTQQQLSDQYNFDLSMLYCISYIKKNSISKETIKEDFKFIRQIERAYAKLFNNYIKDGKIILSNNTNYYAIKNYKKRGEAGTIMAIKYLINMLKYEYNITEYDLFKYKQLVQKYFNNCYKLWFEYNQSNLYRFSAYYQECEYNRPSRNYIYYTDKKYYKIIKNIMGY